MKPKLPRGRPMLTAREAEPILSKVFLLMEQGYSLKRCAAVVEVSRRWVQRCVLRSREGRLPAWIAERYDSLRDRRCDLCSNPIRYGEGVPHEDYIFCRTFCRDEWVRAECEEEA